MQITNNDNKHKTIHRGSPTIQSSGISRLEYEMTGKITRG